jgi:hypothetical protein
MERTDYTRGNWSPQAATQSDPASNVYNAVGTAVQRLGQVASRVARDYADDRQVNKVSRKLSQEQVTQVMGTKAIIELFYTGTLDPAVIAWLIKEDGWRDWLSLLDRMYRNDDVKGVDSSNLGQLVQYLLETPGLWMPAGTDLDKLRSEGKSFITRSAGSANDFLDGKYHGFEDWFKSHFYAGRDVVSSITPPVVSQWAEDKMNSAFEVLDIFAHPTIGSGAQPRAQTTSTRSGGGGAGVTTGSGTCRRDKRGNWVCPKHTTPQNY